MCGAIRHVRFAPESGTLGAAIEMSAKGHRHRAAY